MSYHTAPSGTLLYGSSWAAGIGARADVLDVGVFIGQSGLTGSGLDATRGLQALSSVHPTISPTYRFQGLTLSLYPAACGPAPRTLDLMGTETSSPVLVNRAVSGVTWLHVLETQIPGARADLAALGIAQSAVKFVFFLHGGSSADTLPNATRYTHEQHERICRILEAEYPNALLAVGTIPTQDLVSNPYADDIRAYQRLAAAKRPNRRLVDTVLPSVIDLQNDDTHGTEGPGGGQDQVADRLWAALET